MAKVIAGSWVEIESIILTPPERAAACPEDTRATPLILRVSGFLQEDAEPGSPARIRSIIGREHAGRLCQVNPSYTHSFGATVPELLTIGREVES